MNTAVAPQDAGRKATPVELYRQQVLPPEKAADLFKSLPAHIKPAVFERNLLNALMQNPDLLRFPAPLVYREVSKAAGLGLLLDPQLGEAYMVVAYNYKSRQQEPQLRVGYRGMLKLARQAGDVESIYAHEVHASDKIECHLGTDKRLIHEPKLFGERGSVVGYYAVIKFKSGAFDFEPMTLEQVRAIRDRSDAWKAFKENKIKSTPWSTDEGEMAKKTVLRRLIKRQPQSGELIEAIGIEDEAEFPEPRTVRATVEHGDDGPPLPPQVTHQTEEPEPPPHDGQVIWGEEGERPATAEDLTLPDDGSVPKFLDRTNGNSKPKAKEATAADVFDPAAWLHGLEGAFAGCEDSISLGDAQVKYMLPQKERAFPPDYDKAKKLLAKHMARITQTVLDAG